MRKLFTDRTLSITPGQAVSGITERMQTLQIASGSVWITMEGVSHDYWLSAGDKLATIPGRLIVIEADKLASCVTTQPPATQHALSRLGAWLHGLVQRRPAQHAAHGCASCPG